MRILMVEDDKELCVALSICFQAAGYDTEFVYTGEDGLQYGLQNAYDLIILDRLLPQTDGLSIVAQLRQHHHPCADADGFGRYTGSGAGLGCRSRRLSDEIFCNR